MIATSTVVMFVLMYLNTYAWEHLFFSETRAYMAILMGAVMAFVMMGFMASMYPSRAANIAIFAGSLVVFALSLWLVRSQVTVSGTSYMRAMIPHHSIAIMTSERAGIGDARVRRLADEIVGAQRKEIGEMRYLISDVVENGPTESVYRDPDPEPGTWQDAMNNTLLSGMDPAPLTEQQALSVLGDTDCRFARTAEGDPILWTSSNGRQAAALVNGVILSLQQQEEGTYATDGLTMQVTPLGDAADWRSDAQLRFAMTPGPESGYRGFWTCGG